MDDAAALVAIVGRDEVTSIHLIIYEEKRVHIRLSRIVASEHSRVYEASRVFQQPRARLLADTSLIKTSLSNRNALPLRFFVRLIFFASNVRNTTYTNNKWA